MYLRKLYSEPENLFETIEFKDGLNLIIAHRPEGEKGGSLNGVGKSTALDLIDFCLLASYVKSDKGNRLVAASEILDPYNIVLEFEVDGQGYIIKRSTGAHTIAYFAKIDSHLEEYRVSDLVPILSDLMFLPRDYSGRYYNKWYKYLRHFFVKIHKHKASTFADPIEYMDHVSYREFMYLHLFLMGINNNLLYKNNEIVVDRKRAVDTKKNVIQIAAEAYDIEDITEKKRQLQQLKLELKSLEDNIENYKLAKNYSNAEDEANELTAEIKKLWLDNLSDRRRISELQSSIAGAGLFTKKDATRVAAIYKELNEGLGLDIKATLEDAIAYRRNLVDSRQNFISTQLRELEEKIIARNSEIEKREDKRVRALSLLTAQKAITDLSEAYLALSRKREELNEIESIIATSDRIERQLLEIETEESKINLNIKDFVDEIQGEDVARITSTFHEIYNSIYKQEKRKPTFSILPKMEWESKVEIDIKVPSGLSKARNQGKVLIYDLTILLTMIRNKQRGPRFLVHDGIFDGMDPEHFSNLYIFLEQALHAGRFQYIATLNESEGTRGGLSKPLSEENAVTMQELIDGSVLDLTPAKKLLGRDFD